MHSSVEKADCAFGSAFAVDTFSGVAQLLSLGGFDAVAKNMKIKMAAKLVLLGALIVAVAYWLRGHDMLTGLGVIFLFLFAVVQVVRAIISRRGRPPLSGGGSHPPNTPLPVTTPPRPPGAPPVVYCEPAA